MADFSKLIFVLITTILPSVVSGQDWAEEQDSLLRHLFSCRVVAEKGTPLQIQSVNFGSDNGCVRSPRVSKQMILQHLESLGPIKVLEVNAYRYGAKMGEILKLANIQNNLRYLSVSPCENEDWSRCPALKQLKQLDVRGWGDETIPFLEILKKFKNLETLNLHWCDLENVNIAALAESPKLKNLSIQNCTINQAQLSQLMTLKLTNLSVSLNEFIKLDLAACADTPSKARLNFTDDNLTSVEKLTGGVVTFSTARHLNPDAGPKQLPICRPSSHYLSWCQSYPNGALPAATPPPLTGISLKMRGTSSPRIFERLPSLPETLDFSISSNDPTTINPDKLLEKLPALTTLKLSNVGFNKSSERLLSQISQLTISKSPTSKQVVKQFLESEVEEKILVIDDYDVLSIMHSVAGKLNLSSDFELFVPHYDSEEKYLAVKELPTLLNFRGLKSLTLSIHTVDLPVVTNQKKPQRAKNK